MKAQTLSLKTVRDQAKFGVIVASAWVLTACSGYGTTGGGLQVGGLGYNGSEFTNGSSSIPVNVTPDSTGSGTVVTPVSIAAPATEAEAFAAIESVHGMDMRSTMSMAGAQVLAAFDDLTPAGPPAPASSPYGGSAAPPVTPPTNPVDNPPTGVDNPDDLPVLDASGAKKSGSARIVADEIQGKSEFFRQILAQQGSGTAEKLQTALQNLEALNLTNLSAETQSMVQGNILVLDSLLALLK